MKVLKKICLFLILIWLIVVKVYAQTTFSISGHIKNEGNILMAGVMLEVNPGNRHLKSNNDGYFNIPDLFSNKYFIKASFPGYELYVDTIVLNKNRHLEVILKPVSENLDEIIVKGSHFDIKKKEEAFNIEHVKEAFILQNLSGSLMKSIEKLPGVTTIDIGASGSKPVIRGMSFNRVTVVENGVKHEAQQWGADHSLEIDQYGVENIEIIKGPASILYGSDAIGGVIHILPGKIPPKHSFGTIIDLTGKSGNNFLGTSISAYARKESIYFSFRTTFTDYADYKVPTDSVDIYSFKAPLYERRLRNTAGEEKHLHFTLGFIKKHFTSGLYVSSFRNINGFFADAHGLEPRMVDKMLHDKSDRDIQMPYHKVNHLKAVHKSKWLMNKYNIETEIGFQKNFLQEFSAYVSHGYMPSIFPDTLPFSSDLERQFDKQIGSGNIRLNMFLNESVHLTIGLNSDYEKNNINGRNFIIPAYQKFASGLFSYGKYKFSEKNIVHAAFRYDYGNIQTELYRDWFPSPVDTIENDVEYKIRATDINRTFSNWSWSVGYNHNRTYTSYKINIGKSFRMPIAKELAANGVNFHMYSFEKGNSNLNSEVAYQLDMGFSLNKQPVKVELTPFINYFTNYLYLNPTYQHDSLYGNGNQIYIYTESEVFRYGGEIQISYEIMQGFNVEISGEYVYAVQMSGAKKGYTLPFSPPLSGILNIHYAPLKLGKFTEPFISFDYKMVAAQNNVVPPEEKTSGYQNTDFSLGSTFLFANQKMSASFQIQNLFNSKFFNHTSYYRLINVPEPGRNFVLNIQYTFNYTQSIKFINN